MMSYFTYTLIGDGSSDRALIPIIDWSLRRHTDRAFSSNYASFPELATHDLDLKVERALGIYPCDILFVHRDAERAAYTRARFDEVARACANVRVFVAVIPVCMTEAWLLLDQNAIRRAADNPNGNEAMRLPSVRELERILDPKERLFDLLRSASGLSGRRLRSFREGRARARVAELIEDFSPLLQTPAFRDFDLSVVRALEMIER